jgi:exodeoxyribonuclease-3
MNACRGPLPGLERSMTRNPGPIAFHGLPRRVLALNIRAGGGSRWRHVLDFLEARDADTIVLTEWRDNPAGQRIAHWSRVRGLHTAGLADGNSANGIFIALRRPFATMSHTPRVPVSGVLMQARFPTWRLLAAYFPSVRGKPDFFDRCMAQAARHARTPFLLIGDLNTGNQFLDRDPRGVRYHSADAFDRLGTLARLTDLWRHTHGAEARDWSWLSHRQNGFRLDHAFANRAMLRTVRPACHYDHAPREQGWSDHSAIILDMALRKPEN